MAEVGFIDFDLKMAVKIIEEESKYSLGQALRTLQNHVAISDGWKAALHDALRERNRFVHHYLTDSRDRMVDPRGRDEVILEIKQIRKTVIAGNQAVRQMLHSVLALGGIDFDELESEVAEEVRDLNSRE